MLETLYKSSPYFLKHSYIHAFKALQYLKYKLGIIRLPENGESSLPSSTMKAYNQQRLYGFRPKLCYAPYTSMFFSRAGYMSPCYATYGEKSDRWPEKSIHEAWFHGRFKGIRQAMDKGDLHYACEFCQPVFENHNFGSLLPEKYEHYGISTGTYPKIMEFELSNRCNLQCIMCDGNLSSSIRKHRDKKPAIPDVYDARFLKELREFIPHLEMAEFTGGDPFLIPLYYDIWEMIRKTNPSCRILITTNANTWSGQIENLLQSHKNLHYNISIDSLRPEVYEKIRVGADFNSVMENTKRFIDYCHKHNTTCNILVCPMSINLGGIPDLIEFGNQHGCGVFFHTVVKPKDLSLKHQSAEQLQNYINDLKRYTPPQSSRQEKQNAGNYHSLISQLESWHAARQQKEHEDQISPKAAYEQVIQQLDKPLQQQIEQVISQLEKEYPRDRILTLFRGADAESIKGILKEERETSVLEKARQELKQEAKA